MTTAQNNAQNAQDIDTQLVDLIKEAKTINQAIRENGEKTIKKIDSIDAKINDLTNTINQSETILNQAEKDAREKIDRALLEDAEYLADNE